MRSGSDTAVGYRVPAIGLATICPSTGRCLDMNDLLCEMLGYSRAELQSLTWAGITHPDDRAAEGQRMDEVLTGRRNSYGLDKRLRRRDGRDLHTVVNTNCVRQADGRVRLLVAAIQETGTRPRLGSEPIPDGAFCQAILESLTERKVAEQRLRRSEASLATAQRIAKLGDWELDLASGELRWSAEIFRIFGLDPSRDQPRQELFYQCVHPQDRETVRRAVARALAENTAYSLDHRIVLPDGTERVVHEAAEVSRDDAGRPGRLCGTVQDITAQKNLEAQFLRAQRLEGIGSLASGIAHDLNNILTPIVMCAPLVREELSPEERLQLASTLETSAHRAVGIVRQLLGFGRGRETKRSPLQLKHLVREIAKIARETFPRSIAISEDTPADLWSVVGDATQLHQVLLNLCVNARDAMPQGGTLLLRARNIVRDPADSPTAPEGSPGPHVQIQVVDSGEGIPESIQDRVFSPFFTTKEPERGTGLGLATALGIVKSHGGFIRFTSRPGQGTTFEFCLPATSIPESTGDGSAIAAPLPPAEGGVILVADDEMAIREASRRTLRAHGYEVLEAADGIEAISLLAGNHARVRAMIIDLDMPLMDGLTVCRAARRLQPRMPIVVSTGTARTPETETVHAGLAALQIHQLLSKPYTSDVLLRTLHDALAAAPSRG